MFSSSLGQAILNYDALWLGVLNGFSIYDIDNFWWVHLDETPS